MSRWVALGLLALAACQQKQLAVISDDKDADDFGLADVTAAVAEMARTPDSPPAYRALAVRLAELRPRFNDRVADHAELELAFLSLGPLRAQLAQPPDAALEALATTVWPTALGHEPKPGESPRAYLERMCGGPLAGECKYVVPEAWPVVMSAKVWARMKTRARASYGDCSACQRDPSYDRALEDFDRHDTEQQRRARMVDDRSTPAFWPRAGGNAAPWSDPPLLELGADTVTFVGEALSDVEWRAELRRRRTGDDVLGVHLRPRQEVRTLRAALRDAAAAGYREVALVVRDGTFPYPRMEYRISTRPRGRGLGVRDVDTIQVLVQALDAAAGRLATGERAAGASRPPAIDL